jgi:hypothetical protein
MNNCENKIKLSCPPNLEANCVKTDVVVPAFSTLTTDCNSVKEVETDMYTLIGNIKEEIDVTGVTSECETLPVEKTVKTLIEFLIQRDCEQQAEIASMQTQIATMQAQILALQENQCL